MKIGVIGSGNMGRGLGVRFAQLGHQVIFGARRLEQASEAANLAGSNAQAGSNEDATSGDVLIWTIREPDPSAVLKDPQLLKGKIIIDLNNRDYAQEARTGAWFRESIAERLQANAPGARVVKAFNTIAMEAFDIAPEALRAAVAQTFLAGDDAAAKHIVAQLAAELGFKAVDAGQGNVAFRAVEALGDVIRVLMVAAGHGGRAHLTMVTLPEPTLRAIGSRLSSKYH